MGGEKQTGPRGIVFIEIVVFLGFVGLMDQGRVED